MVKVAFDSKSHQVIRHQGTEPENYSEPSRGGAWRGQRLVGLASALTARGYTMDPTDLEAASLREAGVLVISGRRKSIPFSDGELAAITDFFTRGGGLFLMANHKGFVEPQNQVARTLDLPIIFHEEWVRTPRIVLVPSHPISQNCPHGLQIRTSCSMTLGRGSSVTVLGRSEEPNVRDFAAAIEPPGAIAGKAVVMTSGGHISSLDDSRTDLFAGASNETWTLNAIEWLAGRLPE